MPRARCKQAMLHRITAPGAKSSDSDHALASFPGFTLVLRPIATGLSTRVKPGNEANHALQTGLITVPRIKLIFESSSLCFSTENLTSGLWYFS